MLYAPHISMMPASPLSGPCRAEKILSQTLYRTGLPIVVPSPSHDHHRTRPNRTITRLEEEAHTHQMQLGGKE